MAPEVVRRERPDLVLSDTMMPGLNWRDLYRHLKADSDLAGIRVVLMSAVSTLDRRNCGGDAFIAKPFDVATLAETVRRLL